MSIRESTFVILTVLVDRPLHGYGVMQAANALGDGRATLRPSTLYAALDRLAEDGLVVVDREEAVDGRLRRYYRLTDAGADALAAEIERMRAAAAHSAGRLRARAARLSVGEA